MVDRAQASMAEEAPGRARARATMCRDPGSGSAAGPGAAQAPDRPDAGEPESRA